MSPDAAVTGNCGRQKPSNAMLKFNVFLPRGAQETLMCCFLFDRLAQQKAAAIILAKRKATMTEEYEYYICQGIQK